MMFKYLPVVIILILAGSIAYGFLFSPHNSWDAKLLEKTFSGSALTSVCKSGESKDCNDDNECSGKSVCIGGFWTGCITEKICSPEAKTACVENFCAVGYKICNKCGTGYGDCFR